MPKRKVSSEEVMAKEGPKRRLVRMSAESDPAKVETKPKKLFSIELFPKESHFLILALPVKILWTLKHLSRGSPVLLVT
uniref:Uncharacterized protein n=1 Tax=Canis lupus familiaris TaxID=9615 RepID=A0A8C0PXG1_CANLF